MTGVKVQVTGRHMRETSVERMRSTLDGPEVRVCVREPWSALRSMLRMRVGEQGPGRGNGHK